MKIKATALKKPLQLMMSVGFIAIGLMDSAEASFKTFATCKRCALQAKKCATDEAFYENCNTTCPTTGKKDPIEKCRAAHEASMKPKISCKKKQQLIKRDAEIAAEVGIKPYSKEDIKKILLGCEEISATADLNVDKNQESENENMTEEKNAQPKAENDNPVPKNSKYLDKKRVNPNQTSNVNVTEDKNDQPTTQNSDSESTKSDFRKNQEMLSAKLFNNKG